MDLAIPLAQRVATPEQIRVPSNRTVHWRPLTASDSAAILALENRVEDHDRLPFRTTESEIMDMFDPAVPHAAFGAFDTDALAAYGCVRVRVGENGIVRATCSGAVAPERRGTQLGTGIIQWQLDMAKWLLVSSGLDGPAQIAQTVDGTPADTVDLLRRNGFTVRRTFTQMRRNLQRPIPRLALESYLEVIPWDAALDDTVRLVHNLAFSEYGHSLELSAHQWGLTRQTMVPEWSFIALDRSGDRAQVAGYIMCSRWEDDWTALGWREGYIESLGVMAPYRRRGLARALLTSAMEAFRDSGMDYAGIDVSSDDAAETSALYAGLGFRPSHHSTMFVIDL